MMELMWKENKGQIESICNIEREEENEGSSVS